MIGIKAVAGYLPQQVVRNADVADELGFKPGFLENKVGVVTRHVAAPDESTSDMCVRAFERLHAHHPEATDVGLVLLCSQNPDYKLPHTASVLQGRLGLPKSVLAFDISLGCSGYVASLVTAKALMSELGTSRALLFTCDPYTKVLAPDDKSTVPLFSDAATVTLLERGAPLAIGKGTFGNDGSAYATLIVRGSGTARAPGEVEAPLRMDGRNIYAMLKNEVPGNIRDCLAANDYDSGDVDAFVFHQASAWLLKSLVDDLQLDPARVPSNLAAVGNTVSSSIPLLLADMFAADAALPRVALLSGFGVGLSWASVVLTRQDGPASGGAGG